MNKKSNNNLYGRVLKNKTLLNIFSLNNVSIAHNSLINDYKTILI